MTGEPKLESFLANMSDESFSIAELVEDREELEEVLWYLDKARTKQVTTALQNIMEDGNLSRHNIIINLVRLYPLSQELVHGILMDIPQSDYDFYSGVDICERLLGKLKELLNEAQNQSLTTTKRFKDFQEDVERLFEAKAKLESDTDKFQELKEQRRELIKQVEVLKQETDEASIRQIIADLEDEVRNLEWQKNRQEETIKKKQQTINKLNLELASMKNKLDSDKQQNLLRELLKTFPPDAEDGK